MTLFVFKYLNLIIICDLSFETCDLSFEACELNFGICLSFAI